MSERFTHPEHSSDSKAGPGEPPGALRHPATSGSDAKTPSPLCLNMCVKSLKSGSSEAGALFSATGVSCRGCGPGWRWGARAGHHDRGVFCFLGERPERTERREDGSPCLLPADGSHPQPPPRSAHGPVTARSGAGPSLTPFRSAQLEATLPSAEDRRPPGASLAALATDTW